MFRRRSVAVSYLAPDRPAKVLTIHSNVYERDRKREIALSAIANQSSIRLSRSFWTCLPK